MNNCRNPNEINFMKRRERQCFQLCDCINSRAQSRFSAGIKLFSILILLSAVEVISWLFSSAVSRFIAFWFVTNNWSIDNKISPTEKMYVKRSYKRWCSLDERTVLDNSTTIRIANQSELHFIQVVNAWSNFSATSEKDKRELRDTYLVERENHKLLAILGV